MSVPKEIVIDGTVYTPQTPVDTSQYVMIRTDRAGVHYGLLDSRNGREVVLKDARRVFSWSGGANTLNELSQTGPTSAKISQPVPSITLLEAIEVIPMTSAAVTLLGSFKWK